MKRDEELVKLLLHKSIDIETKSNAFSEWTQWMYAVGRNMGVGARTMYEMNQNILEETESAKDKKVHLVAAIREVVAYIHKKQEDENLNARRIAANLRILPEGTMIVFKNRNREEVAKLIAVKSTRFKAEYSDGRLVSVPCVFFLRVAEGRKEFGISEEARKIRALIRQLSGKHFEQVSEKLLVCGNKSLPYILDELGAAFDRIKDAPAGFSNGVFRSSVGIVKKVNPLDQALIKRIPKLVVDFSRGAKRKGILKLVQKHPHDSVRTLCLNAFETSIQLSRKSRKI